MMADSYDSERLRGGGMVAEWQTDGWTDRWTFAILELLSQLKRQDNILIKDTQRNVKNVGFSFYYLCQ